MKRVVHYTLFLILDTPRSATGLTSITLFGFGLWLLIFERFEVSPTFNEAARVAPQWVWGWALTVPALIRLTLQHIRRYHFGRYKKFRLRLVAVTFSVIVFGQWLMIFLMFIRVTVVITAIPVLIAMVWGSLAMVGETATWRQQLASELTDNHAKKPTAPTPV